MKDTMIGVDLAKNIIVLHGTSMTGELRFRKKLSRGQFIQLMQRQPAAIVVLEACGSAHYWARELTAYGHEVKLIAPQYVRPFVKRQKNDMADAEAIAIAARQPEMRFVEPKTLDQQARAVLFRGAGSSCSSAHRTGECPASRALRICKSFHKESPTLSALMQSFAMKR